MIQTLEEAFPEIWDIVAEAYQEKPPSFRQFFEEAVYITDAHKGLIKVEPWPHLLAMADAWESGQSEIALKARQLGVSYLLAAFVVYQGQYKRGSTTLVFSQGQMESHEIIDRAMDIYMNQPKGWKVPLVQQQKGRLAWKGGGRVMAFSSSKKGGRSFTATTIILDEAATHPDMESHWASMKPVISAGGQVLVVGTAQGDAGWFRDMYWDSKAGMTSLNSRFIAWDARPDRDGAWLERERRDFKRHPALFRQEYPANDQEAFVSFSGLVFGMAENGEEILSREANFTRPPCRWEEYKARIAGVDPGGRDPTAIVFLGITRDERLHIHDEWQIKEAIGADTIAAQIWRRAERAPINAVFCDASNRVLTQTLVGLGLPAFPASRDKGARISTMSMLFRARRLTISPWCTKLSDQLWRYFWDERDEMGGGGRSAWATSSPTKEDHSDAVDAAGYAVLGALQYNTWKTRDDSGAEGSGVRIRFR